MPSRDRSRSRGPETTVLPAFEGQPALEVLVTSDEAATAEFLKGWTGCRDFGLDIEYRPIFEKGAPPAPCALLQICSGTRVLLFDLHVARRRSAPIPAALEQFLEDEQHTFYGMGLTDDLVRLAFEYDCVCRGVDMAMAGKTWPALQEQLGGGLAKVCNRILGTEAKPNKKITMSNWERRPLTSAQIQYAASDAYLSWALAAHFLRQSPIEEDWLVQKENLYWRGMRLVERGLVIPETSKHDW